MPTSKRSVLTAARQPDRPQAVCALSPMATSALNAANAQPASRKQPKEISIFVGQDRAVAELDDNPTSRDFIALLPMTVTLEDFAGKEKVKRLSQRLSTSGSPANQPASVWDIAYYVPWGNIAIFYKPYDPSPDLIRMGRVVSGQDILTRSRSLTARIELAK
jgi:hypothetical protein